MSHVVMQIKRHYRNQQNEMRQKANKLWENGCHLISAAESVFEQHAVIVNKASLISGHSSTKGDVDHIRKTLRTLFKRGAISCTENMVIIMK